MKWIQWLIDNAWSVVIVGGVLLQLLQAVMKKKGGEEAPPAETRDYEFEDPELAERTRQIREEIQRKIEQRSRGTATPRRQVLVDTSEAPPLIADLQPAEPEPVLMTGPRMETRRQAEILEKQAEWAEKLEEARRLKSAIEKRTAFEFATADHQGETLMANRSELLVELRSPEALRRAFVLREVLGPPVALRR